MGRPPKSENELKAKGTYRPAYHANRFKAKAANGLPPAPDHFEGEHLEKWRSLLNILKKEGLLSHLDYDALVLYVETWILSRMLYKDIQAQGVTITKEAQAGTVTVANPSLVQYQQTVRILNILHDKFGFTPRARNGINVPKGDTPKADPLRALLNPKQRAVNE